MWHVMFWYGSFLGSLGQVESKQYEGVKVRFDIISG